MSENIPKSTKRFENSEDNLMLALLEKLEFTEDLETKKTIRDIIESRSSFRRTQMMLSRAIFKTWVITLLSLMLVAVLDIGEVPEYVIEQIISLTESKVFWIPISAVLGTFFVTGILDTVKYSKKDPNVLIIEDGKIKNKSGQ